MTRCRVQGVSYELPSGGCALWGMCTVDGPVRWSCLFADVWGAQSRYSDLVGDQSNGYGGFGFLQGVDLQGVGV